MTVPRWAARLRRGSGVLVTVLAVLVLAPTGSARAEAPAAVRTVVSLTFDDSNADQLAGAAVLDAHGLAGTFFTNSGVIGLAGRLTRADLRTLQQDGHEIGGHTVDHPDLTTLSPAAATAEICDDRATLTAWGLRVTTFAYPFAASTPQVEAVAAGCGYASARSLGGVRSRFGCPECPAAETLPPADPFHTRAPQEVDATWTLADLERTVTDAEDAGGGWVQLTFHHVCSGCDGLSVSPALLDAFAGWVVRRAPGGTVVRTVAQAFPGLPGPVVGVAAAGRAGSSSHPPSNPGPNPGQGPSTWCGHAVLTWALLVLSLGVNVLVWTAVGAARWLHEHPARRRPAHGARRGPRVRPEQVAVLVAAHDEQLGVGATVLAAHALVPRGNVFVVSDGSHDDTVVRAREAGATVLDLQPNRGKAGALAVGIAEFGLPERFEVVLLLDADTVPTADYLVTGLPQFDDPGVVAVAGNAATVWDPTEGHSVVGHCLRAYRERQYVLFQVLVKYGQAARAANAVTIVPGFASMYRTRILSEIDIAAPGLAIEDFNMTFEVHARNLGRIAFHPRAAVAHTQDPDNLVDYRKQVGRWSLGFWQTVRRHGFHRGRFWFALAAFVVELLTSSVLYALLGPLVLVVGAAQLWGALLGGTGVVGGASAELVHVLPLQTVVLGVVLPDLALTVGVAVLQRRPVYLLVGLTFLPLRSLDALLCLRALWSTGSTQSPGTWSSPARRAPAPAAAPGPLARTGGG